VVEKQKGPFNGAFSLHTDNPPDYEGGSKTNRNYNGGAAERI
jgi:hypothetical protein